MVYDKENLKRHRESRNRLINMKQQVASKQLVSNRQHYNFRK